MSRKKRRPGHFCWCCGQVKPNERFSGRGHMGHLCRKCRKLGPDELTYRQAVRDIDRMVGLSGVIRRKRRASFERFFAHADPRVRLYAEEVARADEDARRRWRLEREAEEEELEAWCDEPWCDEGEQPPPPPPWVTQALPNDPALDELVPVWEAEETPEAAIEDTFPHRGSSSR